MKRARLIMVSQNNNNKYYNMDENSNGTFTVKYGRIDSTESTATYSIKDWDKKYKEKIKKGYVDRTSIFLEKDEEGSTAAPSYTDIQDPNAKALVESLLKFANDTIKANYKVSSSQVTENQIKEAQKIITTLLTFKDANRANESLLELFSIIPRNMSNVKYHLIENIKELPEVLSKEQSLLDTMEGQVKLYKKRPTIVTTSNILESHNLEITLVEDGKIIDKIKKLMGDDSSKFVKAYNITNNNTLEAFKKLEKEFSLDKPNKKLLWHGSRNENWWSIATTGLLIRPANAVYTGSMFGDGIYFADKARKSLGYTSYSGSYWARGKDPVGYLAIYDVYLGNSKTSAVHNSSMYSLNYKSLIKDGYHSFFAQGGASLVNNEYIIYRPDQCTIKYLIEFK